MASIIMAASGTQIRKYLKTGEYPSIGSQGFLIDSRKHKNTHMNDLLLEFSKITKLNAQNGHVAKSGARSRLSNRIAGIVMEGNRIGEL